MAKTIVKNDDNYSLDPISFENAKLRYVNFAGINRDTGDIVNRGFNVILNEEQLQMVSELGLNVYIPKRNPNYEYAEDWEPQPQLKVKIAKAGDDIKPFIRIFIVDDEKEQLYRVDNEDQAMLEKIDRDFFIHSADVTVVPFHYSNSFGEGFTVNLNEIYLHVTERQTTSQFADKYSGYNFGQ